MTDGAKSDLVAVLLWQTSDGRIAGPNFALAPRDYVIGRGPSCDLDVGDEHSSVSRSHARLVWADQDFQVRDGGSLGGTWVNGRLIPRGEEVPLRSGEHLSGLPPAGWTPYRAARVLFDLSPDSRPFLG